MLCFITGPILCWTLCLHNPCPTASLCAGSGKPTICSSAQPKIFDIGGGSVGIPNTLQKLYLLVLDVHRRDPPIMSAKGVEQLVAGVPLTAAVTSPPGLPIVTGFSIYDRWCTFNIGTIISSSSGLMLHNTINSTEAPSTCGSNLGMCSSPHDQLQLHIKYTMVHAGQRKHV